MLQRSLLILVCLAYVAIATPAVFAQAPSTQPVTTQPADSIKAVMGDFISWIDQKAALLHGVQDEAGAKLAANSLKNSAAETKSLSDRQARLMAQPIDAAVQKELQEKYGPQLQASMAKLMAERQRISRDPALRQALGTELETALSVFNAQPSSTTRPAR